MASFRERAVPTCSCTSRTSKAMATARSKRARRWSSKWARVARATRLSKSRWSDPTESGTVRRTNGMQLTIERYRWSDRSTCAPSLAREFGDDRGERLDIFAANDHVVEAPAFAALLEIVDHLRRRTDQYER